MRQQIPTRCVLITTLFLLSGPWAVVCLASNKGVDLQLQIAAITQINEMQLTPAQIRAMQSFATDTAGKFTGHAPPATAAYAAALTALRDAVLADDLEKIPDAQEKVDLLTNQQSIDVDTAIHLTATSKQKALASLKTLTSSQIASYLALHANEVPDATATMTDAMDQCRQLSQTEYVSLREEAAQQVAVLMVGLDESKSVPISDKVSGLIDRAQKLSAVEFKDQRPALEEEARRITAGLDPITALQHWLEREMAELLANPEINNVLAMELKR